MTDLDDDDCSDADDDDERDDLEGVSYGAPALATEVGAKGEACLTLRRFLSFFDVFRSWGGRP